MALITAMRWHPDINAWDVRWHTGQETRLAVPVDFSVPRDWHAAFVPYRDECLRFPWAWVCRNEPADNSPGLEG